MLKFFFLLMFWALNSIPLLANPVLEEKGLDELGDIIGKQFNAYPEVYDKRISFYTGKTPLAAIETPEDYILRSTELSKQSIERALTLAGANKILGLADGIINVKYQVQDGVNNALKDTFMGFFEYQRRKVSEEILNGNIKSHLTCMHFFTQGEGWGSSGGLIALLVKILDLSVVKNAYLYLKKIVLLLFIVLSFFKVLEILYSSNSGQMMEQKTFHGFFLSLLFTFAILLYLDSLWDVVLKAFMLLSSSFSSLLSSSSAWGGAFNSSESILVSSWIGILNAYGYFPAVILAFSDSFLQLLFMLSLGLSLLILIFIKVFSPLFLLVNFHKKSWSIWNYGCKMLLGLSFLPFSYQLLNGMISEMSLGINIDLFYIACSILSLLLLIFIQISAMRKWS